MNYFTINELCASDIATKRNINNTPNEEQKENLIALVERVLDPARKEFGYPVTVTSGFRSSTLNFAVGGVRTSQHCKGEAADLKCLNGGANADLFAIIRNQKNFDQLIWEQGTADQPAWIHVSYKRNGINRNKVTMCIIENGKKTYRDMKY